MDEMVYTSLYQGLRPEGALMADLARWELKNLLEFVDKVEEYINQEETLWAMMGSQKAQVLVPKNPENKKKNLQAEQATEDKRASSSRTTTSRPSTRRSMKS
jgi:hypothetical protein